MKPSSTRMPLIDAFKAIASQLIVLHHLSAYGPLSEAMQGIAPRLMDGLYEYARIAVQVFLVIAGFLAVRGLSPEGQALARSPLSLMWARYQRLIVPFLLAVGLAIVASALVAPWLDDEMVPARATLRQWLAHALLLHGVLGIESLSAGVWYVAIDFQLFCLMALTLWAGRVRGLAATLVLALGVLSLFVFNRHAELDNWAIYFFGAYALGAAAWWASNRGRMVLWLGVLATVGIAALVLDFRLRIAVALAVALILGFSRRSGLLNRWPDVRPLAFLGQISYSVFLVHFPVCLLVNALYQQMAPTRPVFAVLGMLGAWGVSVLAGYVFYRSVECQAATQRLMAAFGSAWAVLRAGLARLPLLGSLLAYARRA